MKKAKQSSMRQIREYYIYGHWLTTNSIIYSGGHNVATTVTTILTEEKPIGACWGTWADESADMDF